MRDNIDLAADPNIAQLTAAQKQSILRDMGIQTERLGSPTVPQNLTLLRMQSLLRHGSLTIVNQEWENIRF